MGLLWTVYAKLWLHHPLWTLRMNEDTENIPIFPIYKGISVKANNFNIPDGFSLFENILVFIQLNDGKFLVFHIGVAYIGEGCHLFANLPD